MQAIGMIETKGLVAAIESADAMLKAAQVELLNRTFVKGGIVTITVTGDVAAVKSAVDAGAAAVERMGGILLSQHVIPRPQAGVEQIVNPPAVAITAPVKKELPEPEKTPPAKIEPAIKQEVPVVAKTIIADSVAVKKEDTITIEKLKAMTAAQLKTLALKQTNIGLSKDEIAKVSKATLLKKLEAILPELK